MITGATASWVWTATNNDGDDGDDGDDDDDDDECTSATTAFGVVGGRIVWWCLFVYLGVVVGIAGYRGRTLFWDSHGWHHRVAGGSLLLWLWAGCWFSALFGDFDCGSSKTTTTTIDNTDYHGNNYYFAYDLILGCLGITATLTAARDFPHARVKNNPGQSGTLAQRAIVTQAEMMEHAFYQGLNLWQAMYLHVITTSSQTHFSPDHNNNNNNNNTNNNHNNTAVLQPPVLLTRAMALWIVTIPWYVRNRFPVHSFSNNWKYKSYQTKKKDNGNSHREMTKLATTTTDHIEIFMYKIKKWQYVFYKHVILHGLNISMALVWSTTTTTTTTKRMNHNTTATTFMENLYWRLFWISLNAAYALEFFLQSLVKRHVITQCAMLLLNQCLMLISSVAAIQSVFQQVHWPVCAASVLLNFIHRKHDVFNTMIIYCIAQAVYMIII